MKKLPVSCLYKVGVNSKLAALILLGLFSGPPLKANECKRDAEIILKANIEWRIEIIGFESPEKKIPASLASFLEANATPELSFAENFLRQIFNHKDRVPNFNSARNLRVEFVIGDPKAPRLGVSTSAPRDSVLPNLLMNFDAAPGIGPKLFLVVNDSEPQEKWLNTFRFGVGKFILGEAFESRGITPVAGGIVEAFSLVHLRSFDP